MCSDGLITIDEDSGRECVRIRDAVARPAGEAPALVGGRGDRSIGAAIEGTGTGDSSGIGRICYDC